MNYNIQVGSQVWILEKYKSRKSGRSHNVRELLPSRYASSRNENFVNTSKNLLKNGD